MGFAALLNILFYIFAFCVSTTWIGWGFVCVRITYGRWKWIFRKTNVAYPLSVVAVEPYPTHMNAVNVIKIHAQMSLHTHIERERAKEREENRVNGCDLMVESRQKNDNIESGFQKWPVFLSSAHEIFVDFRICYVYSVSATAQRHKITNDELCGWGCVWGRSTVHIWCAFSLSLFFYLFIYGDTMHATLVGLGDACVDNDRIKKERINDDSAYDFGYLLHALFGMHVLGLMIFFIFSFHTLDTSVSFEWRIILSSKCIRQMLGIRSFVPFEIGWAYVRACIWLRSEKG